jgi:hypothetical protein
MAIASATRALMDDLPLQIPAGILPRNRSVVEDRRSSDKEDDLRALNDAYEGRYRFLWLSAAWIMVMLQSAQMFIVMTSMASGGQVSMLPVVVGSLLFCLSVGVFAAVYRFILYPNSRWVPMLVEKFASRVQVKPVPDQEKPSKSAAA